MAVSLPAVGVKFEAQGDQAVLASMRGIERAAQNTGRVVGSIGLSADAARGKAVAASQGIANALESVARNGEAGGSAIRSLVTQVGHLAFAFGVGGPLTAAVGVAGLAIVQMLQTSKDRVLELIAEINRARLTSGQLAEEEARGRAKAVRSELQRVRSELAALESSAARTRQNLQGPESQRRPSLAGTGVGAADLTRTMADLKQQIRTLADSEEAATAQALRATRASAMSRLAMLRQLRDAHRATADDVREIVKTEEMLQRDMAAGNLTLEERVQLLPKAQKASKAAADESTKSFDAQLDALIALGAQGRLSAATYEQLRSAQMALSLIVMQGTGTIVQQVKAWEQLQRAQKATALPGLTVGKGTGAAVSDGTGGPAAKLPMPNIAVATAMIDEEFLRLQESIHQSLASALSSGIAAGFADGIDVGAIGASFKQMTASILQQLGTAAIEIGIKTQAIAKMIAAAQAWMAANPLAAIGIGVALVALGASLGGRRGGGTAGIGTGGRSAAIRDDVTRIQVASGISRAVSPQATVVVNTTLLNPSDPTTQRTLALAMRGAGARGY